MKAIQITMDEDLLQKLDATEEAKREGRSAVLRRAAIEYLRRKDRAAVALQYRRAYRDGDPLGDEFRGWSEEGEWPPE